MRHRPSFNQVTGRSDAHIASGHDELPVHRDLLSPLLALQDEAANAGFSLQLASGFRSFERQLLIWNAKARGERVLLDASGEALNPQKLSQEDLLFAILRWSALPGASRHHWGTDIDIYDAASITQNYQVQLTCDECQGDGPFAALHAWLNIYLATYNDFYRPYARDLGGVAPEPWHLSYRPLADVYSACLNEADLKSLIEATDIELKSVILDNFSHIFTTYIIPPC